MSFALQHGVPRSTARGWLAAPNVEVVSTDVLNMDMRQLEQEVLGVLSKISSDAKL